MTDKEKLLTALDCTLDDVSEGRLVDILVEAYENVKRRVSELEAENAHEREQIHRDRQDLIDDRRRMREDPRYWVRGWYHFLGQGQRHIVVQIQGPEVEVFERAKGVDYLAQPLSLAEADNLVKAIT